MIKANDLRVGNWVLFAPQGNRRHTIKPRARKVHTIYQKEIVVLDGGLPLSLFFNTDDLQPIPLTPEILEKAGFEDVSDPEGSKGILYKRGLFYISFVLDGCAKISLPLNRDESKPRLPYFLPCNPKYLHQLQNLYFALTGEELNIQL